MEKNTIEGKDVFTLLGGLEGIRNLSNTFYTIMDQLPEARSIRDMHPENLDATRENLSLFICGWLGGPKLYKEKYGTVNLTSIHSPFSIDTSKRDLWLACMEKALDQQPIEDNLKEMLLARFRIPATRIQEFCQQQPHGLTTIT